jgi:hypothetical protein
LRRSTEPGEQCQGVRALDSGSGVTYAIAGADGLFIAKEIGGDAVDLLALFELHAWALYDSALRLISQDGRP